MNVTCDVKIDTKHRAVFGRLVKSRERYAAEKPDDGVIDNQVEGFTLGNRREGGYFL